MTRSDARPLHPARPARLRRRAERVRVCGRQSAGVGGSGWAADRRSGTASATAYPARRERLSLVPDQSGGLQEAQELV